MGTIRKYRAHLKKIELLLIQQGRAIAPIRSPAPALRDAGRSKQLLAARYGQLVHCEVMTHGSVQSQSQLIVTRYV